jgi:hypothetical protein
MCSQHCCLLQGDIFTARVILLQCFFLLAVRSELLEGRFEAISKGNKFNTRYRKYTTVSTLGKNLRETDALRRVD